MRKLLLSLAAVISFLATFSQDVQRLIDEGIKLHDEGSYEAALKKYDSAIQIDKKHYLANYEKSYTLLTLKRYDDCIAICKYLLELDPKNLNAKAVYVNLGSAQDDKGDAEEALKTFTKGIKEFPDFHLLHFNRGITYYKEKRDDESMIDLQNALKCKPVHPGSHNYLGRLVSDNNRIPAIMSYFTFLILEPEGKRAQEIYGYLDKLIMRGISQSQDGKGTTVIGIEALLPDKKKKNAENDFSIHDTFLSLSSALDHDEKYKDQNDAEKLNRKLGDLISMFNEKEKGKGFFWDFYTPFLTEMKSKGYLLTACYIATLNSGNEAVTKWIDDEANGTKLDNFYKWLEEYQWNVKK